MDLKQEVNLSGEWRIEIGDNLDFAKADYNDSSWDEIFVPSAWENEGFPGYDGYAWYRIDVFVDPAMNPENLYLQLGRIDDVDQVYVNGRKIGETGQFPPNYQTAYNIVRLYKLDGVLRFGETNIIAVRVYDAHLGGGIVSGDVGIYRRMDIIEMEIDLSGFWKFHTGYDLEWLAETFNDTHWESIRVPLIWEKQGYDTYDGYAVYRKKIAIPEKLSRIKLVLLLGCISDIDETFFNGQRIGNTGSFPNGDDKGDARGKQERAYFIPSYLIHYDADNVIAIRVYDRGPHGGIYKGYVGIASRNNYLKYSKQKPQD